MNGRMDSTLGSIVIDTNVIATYAGSVAVECFGIVGMASKRSTDGIVQLLGRDNIGRGVRVRADGDSVEVDLFIIVEYGISIRAVAETIIETVKYKMEHLTGIKVKRVNVSVEDIRV